MANSHWLSVLHMVIYMFQCPSLHSSHPLLSPLCPQVCSLCLHLHCCLASRIISTISRFHIYVIFSIQYLAFSFWINSLCIIGSRFIHHIRTDSNAFLFIVEKYCIVYMYHSFFIHSSVNGHLGCFHILPIVKSTAVKIGVHVSFSILVSSGYISSNGIAGSYDRFIPSF